MRASKSIVSLFVAFCLVGSMAACTTTPAPPPDSATPTPPAVTEPTTTPTPEKPKVEITTPMKPGVYKQTVKGMNPGMVVEVTLGEKSIDKIEIKEHAETIGVADGALSNMPAAIVAAQSVVIDTVAGATLTSNGIIEAVSAAIKEAGGNLSEFSVSFVSQAVASELPSLVFPGVPTTWDETYDVVVVGGGFAGLAAAHSAQNSGAKTVLIEKMAATGGNSAINGGQYAAYTSKIASKLQTEFNLKPDTAEQHIQDTILGGDRMSDPELVKVMVYGSPFYFDLLLDAGLKTRNVLARPGGHYGYRTYVTENSVGSDITNLQRKLVDESGATVMLETKLVQVYRENTGDQRVVGVRVATKDGSFKNIAATKGVILATGGFSANKEMRQLHLPYLTPDMPTTNNVCATGEGIQIAQAIGANTAQMSNIQRYPWADPNTGVLDTCAVIPFTGPSFGIIYVDQNGARYVNEGERRDVCANAAVNTGGVSTFSIFTREVASFTTDADLETGIAAKRVFKADTLEELCAMLNAEKFKDTNISMDAKVLQQTIDTHNQYIKDGKDPDFGKVMADTMVPIGDGPYYAIPQWPSVHHTMGGLTITPKAEVKDIYDVVIPGLFAAGEVTSGVHGTNRLGSNADADACTFGYVAGQTVLTGELPSFVPKS